MFVKLSVQDNCKDTSDLTINPIAFYIIVRHLNCLELVYWEKDRSDSSCDLDQIVVV